LAFGGLVHLFWTARGGQAPSNQSFLGAFAKGEGLVSWYAMACQRSKKLMLALTARAPQRLKD